MDYLVAKEVVQTHRPPWFRRLRRVPGAASAASAGAARCDVLLTRRSRWLGWCRCPRNGATETRRVEVGPIPCGHSLASRATPEAGLSHGGAGGNGSRPGRAI